MNEYPYMCELNPTLWGSFIRPYRAQCRSLSDACEALAKMCLDRSNEMYGNPKLPRDHPLRGAAGWLSDMAVTLGRPKLLNLKVDPTTGKVAEWGYGGIVLRIWEKR